MKNELIRYLKSLNISNEGINIIINDYSLRLYTEESIINNIKNNIEYFNKLGIDTNMVLEMMISFPGVIARTTDALEKRIKKLEELKLSKEDIIKIIISNPEIFSYSIDSIKDKIEVLQELEMNDEDIKSMCINFPGILNGDKENLRDKLIYFKEINLLDKIIVNPRHLRQGVRLTYARYEYYKYIGKEINEDNFVRLFEGQKSFEKRTGISKQELIARFNYDERERGRK